LSSRSVGGPKRVQRTAFMRLLVTPGRPKMRARNPSSRYTRVRGIGEWRKCWDCGVKARRFAGLWSAIAYQLKPNCIRRKIFAIPTEGVFEARCASIDCVLIDNGRLSWRYTASPGGKKVCFVIAKPTAAETNPPNRPRNPVYLFVSTRPADKVTNEVSIITGYPFKSGTEASVTVGTTAYALYTQQDGAWIKNATEEAKLVDAMRGGQSAVVKGTSAKGTQSSDTYSLKGLSQALDRVAQECK